MVHVSLDYLKPVLLYVYHSGMRRGEILGLTWEGVDLKGEFIRLKGADTKTSAPVCRDTGIENFVFHDMRHTATTNLRRAGVDALTAMKITGHKTMAVFKRDNTIDEDDLKAAQRQMDTYLDTKQVKAQEEIL